MKKKVLVIQSIIMICLTVVMLTGVSFAWIVSNLKPKVDSFDVGVVGVGNIEYKLLKFDGNGYVEFTPSEANPFINNQQMIPGGEEKRCIQIINQSATDTITVGLDFTRVTFGLRMDNTATFTIPTAADMTTLQENFFIDLVKRSAPITDISLPAYTDEDPTGATPLFERNKFFSQLPLASWSMEPKAFNVIKKSETTVAPGGTLYLYYRFYVKKGFTGLSSLFGINIGGILISF